MINYIKYMRKILKILKKIRFKLKIEKYEFIKKEFKYLRFIREV